MKRAIFLFFCITFLNPFNRLALAQGSTSTATPPASSASAAKVALPPGITEEMLAPPPVPSFMLKKTDKTLTVDEMVQQAREAEKKAGIKPAIN